MRQGDSPELRWSRKNRWVKRDEWQWWGNERKIRGNALLFFYGMFGWDDFGEKEREREREREREK